MKNTFKIIMVIFLFGFILPSGQVFANAKKSSFLIEKVQLKSSLNEDLINKLAEDKNFEQLYYKTFILNISVAFNLMGKSEKELSDLDNKMQDIKKSNVASDLENSIIFKLYGYQDISVVESVINKINYLKELLFITYPELKKMNFSESENIFSLAIAKADLGNKTLLLFDRNSCFTSASKDYSNCLNANTWLRAIIGVALVACVIGTIVCASATAGTTAAALFPLFTGCTVAVFGAFGTGFTTSNCDNSFKLRIDSCIAQFGNAAGGAE